jgi:excisionase family DNA binding protein
MESNDQVFTIKELSKYLRIAESSLYKLVREGKIPGQKIGKTWRFYKPAIDSWLSEKRGDE